MEKGGFTKSPVATGRVYYLVWLASIVVPPALRMPAAAMVPLTVSPASGRRGAIYSRERYELVGFVITISDIYLYSRLTPPAGPRQSLITSRGGQRSAR